MRRTRWENLANCMDVDETIFFEIENATDERRPVDETTLSLALNTCTRCPVKIRCLQEASISKSLGIWAGTTAAERGIRYQLARPEES
jgi:hypothetical protein